MKDLGYYMGLDYLDYSVISGEPADADGDAEIGLGCDHGYRYRRWKVSQRKLVSVINLLRTQLNRPKLSESLEVNHARAK